MTSQIAQMMKPKGTAQQQGEEEGHSRDRDLRMGHLPVRGLHRQLQRDARFLRRRGRAAALDREPLDHRAGRSVPRAERRRFADVGLRRRAADGRPPCRCLAIAASTTSPWRAAIRERPAGSPRPTASRTVASRTSTRSRCRRAAGGRPPPSRAQPAEPVSAAPPGASQLRRWRRREPERRPGGRRRRRGGRGRRCLCRPEQPGPGRGAAAHRAFGRSAGRPRRSRPGSAPAPRRVPACGSAAAHAPRRAPASAPTSARPPARASSSRRAEPCRPCSTRSSARSRPSRHPAPAAGAEPSGGDDQQIRALIRALARERWKQSRLSAR